MGGKVLDLPEGMRAPKGAVCPRGEAVATCILVAKRYVRILKMKVTNSTESEKAVVKVAEEVMGGMPFFVKAHTIQGATPVSIFIDALLELAACHRIQ